MILDEGRKESQKLAMLERYRKEAAQHYINQMHPPAKKEYSILNMYRKQESSLNPKSNKVTSSPYQQYIPMS